MEREWELSGAPPPFESYNVAPTDQVPVVRTREGRRECVLMRWGLVPYWARGVPLKASTINARAESLDVTPSFRDPWRRGQRCILPATAFYEWQVRTTGKQPYLVRLTDREVFGFAGLWDRSMTPDGKSVESCAIITVPANPLLAVIHNAKKRMPAILGAEDHARWLEGDAAEAKTCLRAYPDDLMTAYPVSTRVNKPENNDPGLLHETREK
jgi:putative SOS response-associated peptidase YedK